MTAQQHLWEIDHPYYCSEGSYWVPGIRWHEVHQEFESWHDFLSEWELADEDYNLLFRWDWKRTDPDDYKYEREENPDFEMPGDHVELFYMMQRKARNMSVFVKVTEADEQAVREFLARKAEHMRKLWEPLLEAGK
jgi:hypothetical protein